MSTGDASELEDLAVVRIDQGPSFGTRLRRLRDAAGLTQEELASRAGLTPNAVSDLERGKRRRPYPHTVRSLADALELSEEERAALAAAVPGRQAARSAPTVEPALPVPPTPLLGRERELAETTDLLGRAEVRLLTLTGTGGVGKTRLALEAARASLAAEHFPDGVAFVALAPLGEPALVVPTIARSLGLREARGQTAHEILHAHLREKRLLLALDNFEHLLGAATEVESLVEACPHLTVLATSRAPLRVRGEREYPVLPLGLPASTLSPSAEEVLASPSGRLFLERALAASPGFRLDDTNAEAVASICWRLAGLPLALELAAARVRFLDPATLLARLDRALSAGWARDLPERQRTMRAALDWSHELLSQGEEALFRRLSVFAGGFTLEATEAIGAADGVDGGAVLDLLGNLVEQSLVAAEVEDEARYGMLEPVRQYALEKLAASGEEEQVRARHAAFYLELAEQARLRLRGRHHVEWLDRLERENGNLRAAMSWALVCEVETAARLGWALWAFWWLRDHHYEGHRWTGALLERGIPETMRPRALQVAAIMAYMQGDREASARLLEESLELSQRAGDVLCTAYAWSWSGARSMDGGDYDTATSCFEEALSLFRRAGEEMMVPVMYDRLGMVALLRGDSARAAPLFRQALAQSRERSDQFGTYSALYGLAQISLVRGDYAAAAEKFREGALLSRRVGPRANVAWFLEGLATVAEARGEAERSARLLGAAEGLLQVVQAPIYKDHRPNRSPRPRERLRASVRARLGGSAFEEALAEGRTMTLEKAIEYALATDDPASGSDAT